MTRHVRPQPPGLLLLGAAVGVAPLPVELARLHLADLDDRGLHGADRVADGLADRVAHLLHVPVGHEAPAADEVGRGVRVGGGDHDAGRVDAELLAEGGADLEAAAVVALGGVVGHPPSPSMIVSTTVSVPSPMATARTHRPSSSSKDETGFMGPMPKPPW